jgi:hypothetical protein
MKNNFELKNNAQNELQKIKTRIYVEKRIKGVVGISLSRITSQILVSIKNKIYE